MEAQYSFINCLELVVMGFHRLDKTYNIFWSFCVCTVVEVTGIGRGLRLKFQIVNNDLKF